MLTQPTTDKILLAIANDLNAIVLPVVDDEQAKVLLGQIDQLLRRLSRRSATEIAWMVEEINAINETLGREGREVTSLLLADVAAEYSEASGVLGDAIDEAFAANNEGMIIKLKNLLSLRIEKEQEILGQLDLVGRG